MASEATDNLRLPYIMPSQAQKHVTHNEALQRLDMALYLAIEAESATPPEDAADGSRYLVATGAAGEWDARQGHIACRQDGYWAFIEPHPGFLALFSETGRLKLFLEGAWRDLPLPHAARFETLGIGADADPVNRLSLAAAASLLNHAGAGHQLKINKAGAQDTASLLFQTGWTGHAEMGLSGDNRFSIKVSGGMEWTTALTISASGEISRPAQPAARLYHAGTSFSPVSGALSGFDAFALLQGAVALGADPLAGGGRAVIIPAGGPYFIALNASAGSAAAATLALMRNGNDTLLEIRALSAATQSASGIFMLAAGDSLNLRHSGNGELALGEAGLQLSLALL